MLYMVVDFPYKMCKKQFQFSQNLEYFMHSKLRSLRGESLHKFPYRDAQRIKTYNKLVHLLSRVAL